MWWAQDCDKRHHAAVADAQLRRSQSRHPEVAALFARPSKDARPRERNKRASGIAWAVAHRFRVYPKSEH